MVVGGDRATGPKYTIDAIASGREGAVSIHRYVNVGQTLTIHRNLREFKELDKENLALPVEKIKKPARSEVVIDKKKVLTMCDDRVTFTEEQIKSEASRCLTCGPQCGRSEQVQLVSPMPAKTRPEPLPEPA